MQFSAVSKSFFVTLALVCALPLHAQDWVRERMVQPDSLTGAGGSRAGAAMRLGAIEGALTVFGEVRYNDNVRLEATGGGGTSAEIGAKIGLRYPISNENELTLDGLFAHEFYLDGVRGSHGYRSIEPGSALAMNAYVGRAKLHPFITASLQEDPISSPVLNNTDRFSRLNVDAGVQLDWDMNKVIWQAAVIAGRQQEISGGTGSLNAWREAVSLRPIFPLGPGRAWGLNFSYATMDYDRRVQNDSTTESLGAFIAQALGKNRRMQLSGGYTRSEFDRNGTINDDEDFGGLYGLLQFEHQLRRTMRYTLMAREDISDGVGTNFYRITSVMFTPQLSIWRRGELSANLSHEWIDESGPHGENATRSGLSLGYKTPIGPHLDFSASWQYFTKNSDQPGRDYTRNLYALRLAYSM